MSRYGKAEEFLLRRLGEYILPRMDADEFSEVWPRVNIQLGRFR
jgi:hypothetical protein